MEIYDSIVDTIGNTPLIKMNIFENKALFLGKIEAFNPGRSSKDRIGVSIIDEAEKNNEITPGGTIIEATSGNTGLGLALVAINRGYKVILVMPDKMSPDKMNLVKAIGCKVVVTPTDVEPDDPRSYYSVSKKLSEEIPNSFYANQYYNSSNPLAHYKSTGPEIWRQTDGKITHFIAGIGTGGTISGTAKFLKEKNPDIKVIGIDPVGSILAHFHEHRTTDGIEAKGYKVEGVGEDIIPGNVNFDLIDEIITVSDQESFDWSRKMAREEGLLLGGSSGLVAAGVHKYLDKIDENAILVLLFPDTGERYLGRVFNDSWLRSNGFLPSPQSIQELLDSKSAHLLPIISVDVDDTIADAVEKIKKFRINQLIVDSDVPKLLFKKDLYELILSGTSIHKSIASINAKSIGIIDIKSSLAELIVKIIDDGPMMIKDGDNTLGILTSQDIINNIALNKLEDHISK